MDATVTTLNTFATRVRQMLLEYSRMKKENSELYAMVDERDNTIKRYQEQIATLQRDYDTLKMAKMLEITDGDLESARKNVAKLIREVNKCITMLSEK